VRWPPRGARRRERPASAPPRRPRCRLARPCFRLA
jgi:hypothetical protein